MTYRTRDRRVYRRNDSPATSPNRRTRTSAPPIARNRAAQTEAAPVAEPQPIEASQSTRLGELQTQVQARKTDAQQKQTAAKNAYQQYVSFLDQPSDPTYSILDDNGAASAAADRHGKPSGPPISRQTKQRKKPRRCMKVRWNPTTSA